MEQGLRGDYGDTAVASIGKSYTEVHHNPAEFPWVMESLLVYHIPGNALKFHAEQARLQVRIGYATVAGRGLSSCSEAYADAQYHRLTFSDNGIDFATEYNETIFGIFLRLQPQGVIGGIGMGRFICRKVAEAHRGFITVESTEGKRTTFSCFLQHLSYDTSAAHGAIAMA